MSHEEHEDFEDGMAYCNAVEMMEASIEQVVQELEGQEESGHEFTDADITEILLHIVRARLETQDANDELLASLRATHKLFQESGLSRNFQNLLEEFPVRVILQ